MPQSCIPTKTTTPETMVDLVFDFFHYFSSLKFMTVWTRGEVGPKSEVVGPKSEKCAVAKGRPQLKGKIFQGWRIHLSYWLMRGRVAFFEASKLRCIEPDAHDRRKAAKTGFVGRWCSKRSERTRFGTG